MTLTRFPSDRVTRPAGAAWAADADIRPATAAAPRRDAADFLDGLILIPPSVVKFPGPPAALRAATPACSSGHRRGCLRLPCPETGQHRGSAKELARTMPGRPHLICQAQVA